jgi:hypothetical protein
MDNQTAKEILSAYRPNGEDAADPVFQDALTQCERDPEMRIWFVEQRVFDKRVTSALQTIRAPESGKRAILALSDAEQTAEPKHPAFWRRRGNWLALAACLTLAFISLVSVNSLQREKQVSAPRGLTEMVASAMPLEFRHADTARVMDWLEERGAPVPTALTSEINALSAAGCRIFQMPEGGTVSLICLKIDRELVHVFVYDGEARQSFEGPLDTWWQEAGYNLIATQKDEQLVAYATRAEPDKINYLL